MKRLLGVAMAATALFVGGHITAVGVNADGPDTVYVRHPDPHERPFYALHTVERSTYGAMIAVNGGQVPYRTYTVGSPYNSLPHVLSQFR